VEKVQNYIARASCLFQKTLGENCEYTLNRSVAMVEMSSFIIVKERKEEWWEAIKLVCVFEFCFVIILILNACAFGWRREREWLNRIVSFLHIAEQAFVHEWTKFRYGVFEEIGFENDPVYPSGYHVPPKNGKGTTKVTSTQLRPTSCTNRPLQGNW